MAWDTATLSRRWLWRWWQYHGPEREWPIGMDTNTICSVFCLAKSQEHFDLWKGQWKKIALVTRLAFSLLMRPRKLPFWSALTSSTRANATNRSSPRRVATKHRFLSRIPAEVLGQMAEPTLILTTQTVIETWMCTWKKKIIQLHPKILEKNIWTSKQAYLFLVKKWTKYLFVSSRWNSPGIFMKMSEVVKPFGCQDCGKSFQSKVLLRYACLRNN